MSSANYCSRSRGTSDLALSQVSRRRLRKPGLIVAAVCCLCAVASPLRAADPPPRAVLKIADSEAAAEPQMKRYSDEIPNSTARFEMLPIPGGSFRMGSPESEAGRRADEGPQVEVKIEPFWMGKHEVTWDEYETFMLCLDIKRRQVAQVAPTPAEKSADAVSRPTKPYTDMTFGMGKHGFPAVCMTQLAARMYCRWLTQKTGRYYRLPTEAEWEYACRAGTKTAYSFDDDPTKLGEYAWFADNSDEKYQLIGKKKPNPWGLHDMHGNVSEWVLDQYVKDQYAKLAPGPVTKTLAVPTKEYPRVVRGGSWKDSPKRLRSANRVFSIEDWKEQDPQFPQSIWYFTDAQHVGFRVVRPLKEPTEEEKKVYWDAGLLLPAVQAADKKGCNEG